jgi:hypothetical protein
MEEQPWTLRPQKGSDCIDYLEFTKSQVLGRLVTLQKRLNIAKFNVGRLVTLEKYSNISKLACSRLVTCIVLVTCTV